MMEELNRLYKKIIGKDAALCEALPGAGSNRQYYRMRDSDGNSLIGVVGTSREENHAFCYLARHFAAKGLPVPYVLAESPDGLCYLQTDLGNRSLFDVLKRGRESGGDYSEHERELLRQTIAALPAIQVQGAQDLDFAQCYPQEALDETSVLFDLNYFKYCFLKPTGIDFHELRLEESFRTMAHDIVSIPGSAFMYRDFQARNVMLDDHDNPCFIDFQGGRRGPLQYDVASFLWQASARYTKAFREELTSVYLQELRSYQEVDEEAFREGLQLCVLFRLLQVLGAYGFRGYFERKTHFLESIPPAIDNLRELLADGWCPYPYIYDVLRRLVDHDAWNKESREGCQPQQSPSSSSLMVRVFSFSYRKGIPEDSGNNGGGYVFDCRGVHNPGRYEPYKQLTGLDEPVIRFLEDDGEILTFLESVYELADAHVGRYLERGFNNLMFCFGCTGGQHRSVYSAQHLAEHIHRKFGIEVHVCHREQGIRQVLTPRRAMVFAAGLGTRLKPLTDTMPKALVPVGEKPLLGHLLDRLRAAGFCDVVVNVHHFADMIEDWCRLHPMGMSIRFSDEREQLLETGGGIKHAEPLLRDARDGFLIHNVDILSNADLYAFAEAGKGRAATLLVSERKTQRYLVFDDEMRLVGWTNTATGEVRSPFPEILADPSLLVSSRYHKYAFAGIHYMSPKLFAYFQDFPDRFSIIDFYLKLCAEEAVYGYVQPGLRLMDVGKIDTLAEAEAFVKELERK